MPVFSKVNKARIFWLGDALSTQFDICNERGAMKSGSSRENKPCVISAKRSAASKS